MEEPGLVKSARVYMDMDSTRPSLPHGAEERPVTRLTLVHATRNLMPTARTSHRAIRG